MNGETSRASLASYAKHITALHKDCQLYLSLTNDYLRASNEAEYKQLVILVETLESTGRLIEAIVSSLGSPSKYLVALYAMLDNYEKQESLFPALQSEVNHIAASSTRSMQTKELLAAIRARILAIRKHRERHNQTLFAQIKWSADECAAYVAFIVASPTPNALTMTMCRFCLQHASRQQRAQIIEYLEKAKDVALGVVVSHRQCPLPATMGFLVNQMVPGVPQSAQEVFAFLDAKWSAKQSLEENLRKLDMNVVIIDNRVGSPVYCQMRSLIDEEYITANKLAVSATAGVTGTTLRKMATIVTHNVGDRDAAGAPKVYKKSDGLPWLVLDRWGDDLYRIYRGHDGLLVDSSQISNLLLGCPMRPLVYQECAWSTMQSLHRPDMAVLRSSFASRATAKFDAEYIKGIVLEQIKVVVDRAVIVGKPKKITKAVYTALSDPSVFDAIMQTVQEMYPVEYTQTHEDELWNLAQYDIMARLFYTELDRELEAAFPGFLADLNANEDPVVVARSVACKVVGIVMDRLDKYHVWTECGVSFKKFVARN